MQVSRGGSAAGDSLDQRRRGAHQVDGPRAGAFRRAIGFGREGSPRPPELLPCVSSRWASARREHVPCVAVFCVGHASDCDAWRLTWSYGRGRNNSFWRRRRCGPNAARVSSLSSERLPTQEQSGRGRRWWRGDRYWTGKRALSPFDTWAPSPRTVIDWRTPIRRLATLRQRGLHAFQSPFSSASSGERKELVESLEKAENMTTIA